MNWQDYTIATQFNCSGVDEANYTQKLVNQITLADGTYHQFTYEPSPLGGVAVTGRLASVRLPTGGVITYDDRDPNIPGDQGIDFLACLFVVFLRHGVSLAAHQTHCEWPDFQTAPLPLISTAKVREQSGNTHCSFPLFCTTYSAIRAA